MKQMLKLLLKKKKIKNFYINIFKKKIQKGKKYSNKIMLDFALNQYLNNKGFTYLIFSTADIVVPSNLFKVLSKINLKNFCGLVYPNTQVKNGKLKYSFWPYYGIDLIIFKIDKTKAKQFKRIIASYNQYDWGIIENFYIAICEILKIKK